MQNATTFDEIVLFVYRSETRSGDEIQISRNESERDDQFDDRQKVRQASRSIVTTTPNKQNKMYCGFYRTDYFILLNASNTARVFFVGCDAIAVVVDASDFAAANGVCA
jgi:hypothetical protein